jgi:hypothetical protein
VSVDGTLCFESDKIKLPLGYNFGITAASAENPDSFEIMQFVTTTEQHTPDIQDPNQGQNQQYISNENKNHLKISEAKVEAAFKHHKARPERAISPPSAILPKSLLQISTPLQSNLQTCTTASK